MRCKPVSRQAFLGKEDRGRKGLESRMENGKEEVERSWKERVSGDEGEETGKAGRTCDAWREEEKERGRQEEREIKRGVEKREGNI